MPEPTDPKITVVPPVGQGDPGQLGDGGMKALAAERKRADDAEKASKTLQAQIDKIEADKLSDLQKAQKTAADSEARATSAAQETLRLRVAMAKGIPASLIDRLRGSTQEEIEADADDLLKVVTPPSGNDPSATTLPGPRPDLTQGHASGGSTSDPAAEFATFLGNQLIH